MKRKIIVENNLRVGRFIDTEIKHDEDLILSKDKKVKEFLNKYSKYLNSCEEEDMLEFFKLTGLLIGHMYVERGTYIKIYFSLNGPYSYDYEKMNNKPNAYNNHLIIETYVDRIDVWKSCITADKKSIYQLKEKEEIDVDKYKWELSMLNTKERIEYLRKNNYLLPNKNNIKDILLDPLNNVLSLTNRGHLYINNYLYAKNVKYIFEFNSTDIKFVYNDNVIEEYSNHYNGLISDKYDKALYNENFMAILKDGELIIYLILELNNNHSMYLRFLNVDDIEYKKEKANLISQFLIIKKNCDEIKLPLSSIMLMS